MSTVEDQMEQAADGEMTAAIREARLSALGAGDLISAVPSGRKADGSQIDRINLYKLARPVELDFTTARGEVHARIFYLQWVPALSRYDSVPAVVRQASICARRADEPVEQWGSRFVGSR